MSLISITNLTFAYDGSYHNIFEHVSFGIDTDWKLGFTGRNGRGKTTFLKLLLGKYEYKGKISASVNFEYFPFEIEDKTIHTIDLIDRINFNYEQWELMKELSLLQVEEDVLYRPFNTLSNGEQTKILIAVLFLKENSFLLIDEPTNHLDIGARKIVSDYLKSKKGFILVSHDKIFLDNCIDHILSINKTNIEIQKGNFTSWLTNKQFQDHFELAENEKLKKEISQLSSAVKCTSDWSNRVEKTKYGGKQSCGLKPDKGYVGHKAAKMMKRAKSLDHRRQLVIEEKSKLLKNIERANQLIVTPLVYPANTLVQCENISIFYEEKRICNDVSFAIKQGDRIALSGKNGSGKTSLIKLISGESISYTGDFNKGKNLIISYVSQDTSHLKGNLFDFAKDHSIEESLLKGILIELDFSKVQFEKDMKDFSEGQKKKVLLAKSLCDKAHLYIWDEPLNYIDVLSRMQIEDLILNCAPTILFVEHDGAFTEKVATKILKL